MIEEVGPGPRPGPPPPGPPSPPPDEVPGERQIWPWLLALLVLVLAGVGLAYYLASRDDDGDKVSVPRVVGMNAPQAIGRLRTAGLQADQRRSFGDAPVGRVVAQRPGAGSEVDRDSVVTLSVSRGPATVAVPNLRGLSEAAAASKLTAAGLQAKVFRVASSQPVGTVVAQDPRPAEKVDRGSDVRINVSRGAAQTTRTETTTVVTETTETATTPTATGTTPTTPTATTGGGTGTSTAPVGGATTPAEPKSVPDVVGVTEQEAAATLAEEGFLADSYPVTSDEPTGTVVAQRPEADSQANLSTPIRLNVSIGPGTRTPRGVPDVTGVPERAARSRLRRAGFTVRAIYRKVTQARQNGTVLLQQPDAGTSVQLRAQVTIYVGRLG